jgi:hypothetical protein
MQRLVSCIILYIVLRLLQLVVTDIGVYHSEAFAVSVTVALHNMLVRCIGAILCRS